MDKEGGGRAGDKWCSPTAQPGLNFTSPRDLFKEEQPTPLQFPSSPTFDFGAMGTRRRAAGPIEDGGSPWYLEVTGHAVFVSAMLTFGLALIWFWFSEHIVPVSQLLVRPSLLEQQQRAFKTLVSREGGREQRNEQGHRRGRRAR